MLPVVSIVGRPNVGKSTLFNALTRTRDALVADMPGVTRDRQYGICRVGRNPCVLVDTGGLVGGAEGIDYLTAQQVLQAIEESSLVLFVVSARDGLTAADEEVAETLRRENRPVLVVANKTDGTDTDISLVEFAALGFGDPQPVAAAHRRGLESRQHRCADRGATQRALDDSGLFLRDAAQVTGQEQSAQGVRGSTGSWRYPPVVPTTGVHGYRPRHGF